MTILIWMAIRHASMTKTVALAKFDKGFRLNRDDLDFADASLFQLPEQTSMLKLFLAGQQET